MEIESTDAELFNQKNKDVLLEKIAALKTYVSLLESTIKNPKFKQSQLAEIRSKVLHNNGAAATHNVSDVQLYQNWNAELYHDISQIAEMPCFIKIERNSKFTFEISNTEDFAKKDMYTVEILIDDNGCGKLGKCVLPDFINVQNILWQYPFDDLNNVKLFLMYCKHNIDCYFSRLKQIDELKKLYLEVENIYILYNHDISLIELTMFGVKEVDTTKLYDVSLYLHYNFDEVRPYKLSSTTDEIEISSPVLIRRLNKYFEPFLKMDLTSALLRINEFQNEFIWETLMEEDNEDDIEIYEDETNEENTGFMKRYLYRGDKVTSGESETQNDSMENGNEKIALDENEIKM